MVRQRCSDLSGPAHKARFIPDRRPLTQNRAPVRRISIIWEHPRIGRGSRIYVNSIGLVYLFVDFSCSSSRADGRIRAPLRALCLTALRFNFSRRWNLQRPYQGRAAFCAARAIMFAALFLHFSSLPRSLSLSISDGWRSVFFPCAV